MLRRSELRAVRSGCLLAVAGLILTLFAACTGGAGGERKAGEKLKIVATTGMIADAAANVGGGFVEVKALMGPGVDPHLYTASAGDVTTMRDAGLILYNGLHLEGKMGEVLEGMEQFKPVVAVAENLPDSLVIHSFQGSSAADPHVWFDVARWLYVVDAIEAALVEHDSSNADTFRIRAEVYRDSLRSLDAWVKGRVVMIPQQQRALITAHDAFQYFADAYGFDVYGLQGISTVSEAGTADVRRVAEVIVERSVPAIFVESSVPAKSIEAVQASVRSRGREVAIGGELFSDAMGAEGTPEGTYLGMVRHNVNTIVEALLGGHYSDQAGASQ